MKRLVIWLFFLCLCSTFVLAEEMENKTTIITLTGNLDKSLYAGTKYTSLFKLEISGKKPCSPKDTVTVFYNISKNTSVVQEDSFSKELGCTSSANTGEFTPAETGNYTLCGLVINSSVSFFSNASCTEFEVVNTSTVSCDLNLKLKTNETLFYENGQSIEFKPELNDKSFPFVIEYWIEDLFGEIAKPKLNTTNTNEKSWKTNIDEQDRVLLLKAVVYPSCADLNLSDNIAEKMFVVTKSEATESLVEETTTKESSIQILKITPEEISFGKLVNAEIEIYKGSTSKYSVSVWAEKDGKVISEKTKVHVKNRDTKYTFTIPILLDTNCNEKIKNGDAQLIVEGLELQEEKEFTIEDVNEKLCPKKEEKPENKPTKMKEIKQEKTKTANQTLSLLSKPEESESLLKTEKTQKKEVLGYEGVVVYESVSEKSKNLVPWVLLVAFGLLSLVLAFKIGNT